MKRQQQKYSTQILKIKFGTKNMEERKKITPDGGNGKGG